jgi:hypothetical protein
LNQIIVLGTIKNLFEKSAQSFVYRGFDEIEPFCSKRIPVKGSKILFKQVLRLLHHLPVGMTIEQVRMRILTFFAPQ